MDFSISDLSPSNFNGLLEVLSQNLFVTDGTDGKMKILEVKQRLGLLTEDEEEEKADEGDEEILLLYSSLSNLLRTAVSERWDISVMENYLHTCDIQESRMGALLGFWKRRREEIFASALAISSLRPGLEGVRWRIDHKTVSRFQEEINQPTAIVEVKTTSGGSCSFEVDGEGMRELVETFERIEEAVGGLQQT